MVKSIKAQEKDLLYLNDSPEIPPPDIVAYNELRSCADLFRMHTQHILNIQPEFQREFVWKTPEQTRFIDSLIKKLPIPSMCFSLDYKTEKWQVIDGLQRMSTIVKFLTGSGWSLSKLADIDPRISGQPISKFTDKNSNLHLYFTRVENLALPITVIRCDYSDKDHSNYLFTIFHRLNSGGAKLNNQEIRNCIFSGSLNGLLKELNQNSSWMNINKMKKPTGYRYTKEEIILRFFAFHDRYNQYQGRLAKFLNEYMSDYRNPGKEYLQDKKTLFNRSVEIINSSIFEGRTPQKLTTTLLESYMVGISFNLDFLESKPNHVVRNFAEKLLREDEFSDERLSEGLSGKERVIGRMSTAKRVFAGN